MSRGWGLVAAAFLLWAGTLAADAAIGYLPGVKVVLEVRTAQGDLRSFHRPGAPPTYWAQDLPVIQGDQVTINPMISTGGAELARVKVRLDNELLADRESAPWRVKVDTATLPPGYHLVEVWATTKGPKPMENSATATFLLVPENDPLLAMMKPVAAPAPPVSDEEGLACAIRSRDAQVDEQLTSASLAKVTKPTLFFVSAPAAAKEFFYTLSREGQVTYTSPRLPLMTHILLEPKRGDEGQAPGELILTVRAGDGEGRFGPPAWVTVQIEPGEAAR